jgi:hypothetical protein
MPCCPSSSAQLQARVSEQRAQTEKLGARAEAQAQRAQEAQATIREELRAEAGKQTVALDRWTEALGAALHASLEALAIGRFQELVGAGWLAACVGRLGVGGWLAAPHRRL